MIISIIYHWHTSTSIGEKLCFTPSRRASEGPFYLQASWKHLFCDFTARMQHTIRDFVRKIQPSGSGLQGEEGGGVCRSDSQETKWLHRQLKCNISPLEKLTFVGEFKTGDVALGVLLSPALRPEQEHPAQRPHAAPERAHGPGVEFGDVLQIDASRVDVLSLVWCRRGKKTLFWWKVTLLVFRRFRYEASGRVQARSQQILINTE